MWSRPTRSKPWLVDIVYAIYFLRSWAALAETTNATLGIGQLRGSQLLDHDFLYRCPLENITSNAVSTLNTLDLCNGVVIEEATIDQLQEYMTQRKISSMQLTTCYMNRVFQVEKYIK